MHGLGFDSSCAVFLLAPSTDWKRYFSEEDIDLVMVTIGALLEEDVEEAAKMARGCTREAWESWEKDYCPREAMEAEMSRHRAEEYRRQQGRPDSFIVTAKDDEGIVGICTGYVENEGGVARLTWMGVAPGHRRQGIGNQILQYVEEHVRDRGCHKIHIVTLPRLTDAARLYFKRGWVPECNLTRHSWRVDHMVMGKWFD
jgi:GNAT superfamily N-acetyltransferase